MYFFNFFLNSLIFILFYLGIKFQIKQELMYRICSFLKIISNLKIDLINTRATYIKIDHEYMWDSLISLIIFKNNLNSNAKLIDTKMYRLK